MKRVFLLVALAVAVAVVAPALAGHHTKAECEKLEGMKWDEATEKCVKN
jgi:hypothetical protein